MKNRAREATPGTEPAPEVGAAGLVPASRKLYRVPDASEVGAVPQGARRHDVRGGDRVALGSFGEWIGRITLLAGVCFLILLLVGLFAPSVGLSFFPWVSTRPTPSSVNPKKLDSALDHFFNEFFFTSANAKDGKVTAAELRAVENENEAKLRNLRLEEAKQLKLLLGRRQPQNRKAELYYRLAELHVEEYQAAFLLEGRAHEKRLKDGAKGIRIDRSVSRPHLNLAIDAAQELLRLKIPFERLDRVYYFLSYSYDELDQDDLAQKNYTSLVTKFPSSPLASEGYRRLGELAFENAQFSKAVAYLESALKKAKPESKARIAHKLAWAHYRTRSYESAVQLMKQAVSLTRGNEEKFLALKEEALRDLAIFMTESGRVDEALSYFKEVAGDQEFYPRTLEKLGRQYERNAEPNRAMVVYESILKTHPKSDSSLRVVAKLVDLDLRKGRHREALARLKGVEIPKRPSEAESQTALTNLRAMIRRTGTENHDLYRRKAQRGALEVAELFYTAYLNIFLSVDDPRRETPEIQMYLADVKREMGRSGEASQLYRQVLDSKDKRYSKDAGALWTASLAEAIQKGQAQGGGAAGSSGGGPGKLEAEFVEASDKLSEALGDTAEGRASALRSAQVLAGYRSSHREAEERIRKILEAWPASVQAVTAARLWIQMSLDRLPKDDASSESLKSPEWEKLSQVMTTLRSSARLMGADQENGGKLKGQLVELDSRFRARHIRAAEKDANWSGAAKGYEVLAMESKERDIAEKSFAGALGNYIKAEDEASAERVAGAWFKKFPGSPKASETLRNAATVSLVQGRYTASSRLFAMVGRNGDVASWATAGRILLGSGEKAAAYRLWVAILEESKNSPLRWQVALELGMAQESERMDAEASRAYKYCVAGPVEYEAECAARLGDLYARAADWVQAKTFWRRSWALKAKAQGASQAFAQYARWRLAESGEKEIPVEALPNINPGTTPATQDPKEPSPLKRGIDARLSAAEALKRNYADLVELGGPFGIAALHRQANFLQQFARDLTHVARLPAEKQVAIQIQQAALNAWQGAYDRAVAGEQLSSALPWIADELALGHHSGDRPKVALAQGSRLPLRLMSSLLFAPSSGFQSDRAEAPSAKLEELLSLSRERLLRGLNDPALWNEYGVALHLTGRAILAKLAYERALALQPKLASSLNNRAVLLVSDEWRLGGREDILSVLAAQAGLKRAILEDDFSWIAKTNLGKIYNYYRLFGPARALFEQAAVAMQSPQWQAQKSGGRGLREGDRNPEADIWEGLGVSLQGSGRGAEAEEKFKKAQEGGAAESSFGLAFNLAARERSKSQDACRSALGNISSSNLTGFEKVAVQSLTRACGGGS